MVLISEWASGGERRGLGVFQAPGTLCAESERREIAQYIRGTPRRQPTGAPSSEGHAMSAWAVSLRHETKQTRLAGPIRAFSVT